MRRIYPSDRQLILAVLAGIASHPLIQDPPVYYPLLEAGKKRQVKIDKFRAYSGRELAEPGLTLSVDFTQLDSQTSIEFQPYTLGDTTPGEYLDQGRARLDISLFIQDPAFDQAYELTYDKVVDYSIWLPHGEQVARQEKDDYRLISPDIDRVVTNKSISISFTPAEELLREYMSLLRAVVRDLRRIQPYTVRNPSITSVRYMTAELFEKHPENLVFHKALMTVEFDFFEPPTARDLSLLPPVETINIAETVEH